MPLRVLLALCCLVASPSVRALEWTVQTFTLDDTSINLAVPANFEAMPTDHPVMTFTRANLPNTHRLVAGYLSPEPWRYCLVQQILATRNWRYNARDWQQLLGSFDQSIKDLDAKQLAEEFNRRAEQQTGAAGADLAVRLEKPVILPVLDSSDHHLTFPMLMALTAQRGDDSKRSVVLAACMLMVLQERLVYVFLYEPFTGPESYGILGEKAKEMARRTRDANR